MSQPLPPLDAQSLAFDINHEMRQTVVNLLRGDRPTTTLGLLLEDNLAGLTIAQIASRLDQSVGLVGWIIEKLEAEDLCVRTRIEGEIRVLPLAAYTARNE